MSSTKEELNLDFLMDFNKNIFPQIINIELFSGLCPCNCQHCPVGITEPSKRIEKFGQNTINQELYRKIIDEVANYPFSTLRLQSVGEPLLGKDIAELLKISKNKSVKTMIFTTLITDDISLLEDVCSNTDLLEVSVSSTNSEDYKNIKGVDAFDTILRNIIHLEKFIKENQLNTQLLLSRVETEDNAADEEFIRFWQSSKIANQVFVRSYIDFGKNNSKTHERKNPCMVPWRSLSIDIDGLVLTCSNEFYKESIDPCMILGDIKTQSIKEIWTGDKLSLIRDAKLTSDYSKLAEKATSFSCRYCHAGPSLY